MPLVPQVRRRMPHRCNTRGQFPAASRQDGRTRSPQELTRARQSGDVTASYGECDDAINIEFPFDRLPPAIRTSSSAPGFTKRSMKNKRSDMLKTFKIGGIHPNDNKISKGAPIEAMPLPEKVIIPLSQHIGAPAQPCVAKGDKVKVGDLIGTASGFVSSNIHSSVSGTVVAVDAQPDASGVRKPSVTIAVEGDEWNENILRDATELPDLDAKAIIDAVAAAGVVGMGGATFPTQVKLSVPPGKKAEFLIINGVECEPYLTADHRVMLERPDELLAGVHRHREQQTRRHKTARRKGRGTQRCIHRGSASKGTIPAGRRKTAHRRRSGASGALGSPPYRYRRGSTERRHGIGSIRGGSKTQASLRAGSYGDRQTARLSA